VNDGAYGAGGASFPLANARPHTPCALCDLETDERDVPSYSASQLALEKMRGFRAILHVENACDT